MYNLIQVSAQMLPISKACLTCIKEDPPPVGDLYPLTLPPFPLKWLSPPCNLHTLYVYVHMYVFAYYCIPPTGSKLHEGNKFVSFVKGYISLIRLPRWRSGKQSACQCRRRKRHRFDPWVGKIPWSSKWQPTPVILPGEFHGERSLVDYSPWGCKELDTTEHTHTFPLTSRRNFWHYSRT